MRTVVVASLLAAAVLSACGPGTVRTDRVRMFDLEGRPEREWGYDPPRIEVALGTAVAFVNAGRVFHTVTSDDPARTFDRGADPGQTVTITFDRAGDWPYHCGVHPDMKGLVRVCAGACP